MFSRQLDSDHPFGIRVATGGKEPAPTVREAADHVVKEADTILAGIKGDSGPRKTKRSSPAKAAASRGSRNGGQSP